MALPSSGAISFSQIRNEVNSYATVIPAGPISLSNSNIRDLLSGSTATSGAPYAAGTQISANQAYSKSWRITITRTNAAASTTTYSIYNDAQASPASGESGQWLKLTRPIAFTLTNSSTMRSPSGGTSSYALQTNTSAQNFPVGTTLSVVNNSGCYIAGRGGTGGSGAGGSDSTANPGGTGGRAIEARYNLSITNNGSVAGGGGGGSGGPRASFNVTDGEGFTRTSINGGGGGGGGRPEGAGGNGGDPFFTGTAGSAGSPGTTSAAGAGGNGGGTAGDGTSGGGFGADGVSGSAAGGTAGNSIGKLSSVTVSVTGNAVIGSIVTIT